MAQSLDSATVATYVETLFRALNLYNQNQLDDRAFETILNDLSLGTEEKKEFLQLWDKIKHASQQEPHRTLSAQEIKSLVSTSLLTTAAFIKNPSLTDKMFRWATSYPGNLLVIFLLSLFLYVMFRQIESWWASRTLQRYRDRLISAKKKVTALKEEAEEKLREAERFERLAGRLDTYLKAVQTLPEKLELSREETGSKFKQQLQKWQNESRMLRDRTFQEWQDWRRNQSLSR